jgi:hypothetical protein
MTEKTSRLQPGVTPELHARLAEANAAVKAYPGGAERLAQVIATGLAASRRLAERDAGAFSERPGPYSLTAKAEALLSEPELEAGT